MKGAAPSLRFQVSMSVLSQACGSFLILVGSVFLARRLSKADYGTFQQVQMVSSTALTLVLFGLPHSLYYFIPKTRDVGRLINRTLAMCLLAGLGLGAGLFAGRALLARWMNNPSLADLAGLILPLIIAQVAVALMEPAYICQGLTNSFYGLGIAFSIVNFALLMLLLFAGAGVFQLLAAVAVSGACLSVVLLWRHRGAMSSGPGERHSSEFPVYAQLRYAAPLALSFILGTLGKQVDRYIISANFQPADYAVYARGAMELPLLPMLLFSFSTILMPRYVSLYDGNRRQELVELWHRSVEYISLVNFPAFFLFFFLAKDLMTLLYGGQYAGSAGVFKGYLFLLLFQLTSFGSVVRVIGRTTIMVWATVLTIGVSMGASLALIRTLGFLAPVVGTVLASFAAMIFVLMALSRYLETGFEKIFPWRRLARNLMVAALPVPVLWVCREGAVDGVVLRMALSTFAYGGVYLLLAVALGAVPERERAYLAVMRRRLADTWAASRKA